MLQVMRGINVIKGIWNIVTIRLKHINDIIRFNNFRHINGVIIFEFFLEFFLSKNIQVFYVFFGMIKKRKLAGPNF